MIRGLTPLLLIVAACGGPARPGNDGPVAAPGPAPTLTWDDDQQLRWHGLPAISADRAHVVIPRARALDDGEGFVVTVQDRSEAVVEESPFVAPRDLRNEDETRLLEIDVGTIPADTPVRHDSLDAVNEFLADVHARMHLTPLVVVEVFTELELWRQRNPDVHVTPGDPTWVASADGVEIELDTSGHLTIQSGGEVVIDEVMTAWVRKKRFALTAVLLDPSHHLAALCLSYHGTAARECGHDGVYHLVTW